MAKAKTTKQIGASANKAHAGNGRVKEKLTNKTEAVRRALAKLGKRAMPADIQAFVEANFGVEMTTQLISVYKSRLVKKRGRKGKPGRKPKEVGAVTEPAPKRSMNGGVTFRDLRLVKDISDRLGPARVRELVELMTV
jgi:hypothetical protein